MQAAGEVARQRRPWRRRLILAAAACAGALVLGLSSLTLLDVWAHHKFGQMAGLNVWGYRGPTVGRKAAGEYRIIVLGHSTVFGYGVVWSDAFPAQLEGKLRKTNRRFSVVNLGYNNEGTYSFQFTLRDYAYLKPDLAILYLGYLDVRNMNIFRRDSPVFRLTGYYPLLPIVAREKAMALRFGGDLNAAYVSGGAAPISFRPGLGARSAAATLEAAVTAGNAIGRRLGRFQLDSSLPRPETLGPSDPITLSAMYREALTNAVAVALEQGTSVLVVGQPWEHDGYDKLQQMIQETLADRLRQSPSVRYIDLSHAVDLHDHSLAFDGMHLTAPGNDRIADRLLQPVLDMAARGGSTSGAQSPR